MMAFSYSPRFDAALSYESVTGNKDKEPRKVWDNPKALVLLREPRASPSRQNVKRCSINCTR